jgi:Flp pilus assembly protein TadG
VEFAIVSFGMILLTFAVVQVGLVFYARQIAMAAATQGVDAARGFDSNTADGRAQAQSFLSQAGDGLTDQNVTVVRNGQAVQVTVSGHAISVLPGFSFTVNQSAHGTVERISTPGNP